MNIINKNYSNKNEKVLIKMKKMGIKYKKMLIVYYNHVYYVVCC